MKIGILTIYDNNNLGNRMQNYALQTILNKYGNQIVSIKSDYYGKSKLGAIKRKIGLNEWIWLLKLLGLHRKAAIVQFTKTYIQTSSRVYLHNLYKKNEWNSECSDIYCAGSDQIWNPHRGWLGMFNYLGFAERDRTFSYAASFGIDKIPKAYEEAVRKGLNHIKYISVREDAGKRIVEELTGRTDVQVLVDPTMLLMPEQWDAVAESPKVNLPKKYLLTYFLGEVSESRRKTIETKAKEMGCETIWLMDKKSPFYAIGPGHFVYLVKHAAMICTDSFHGSIFSFLYGRPLAVFDRKGGGENMSSRLQTLASKFSLQDQLVQNENLDAIPLAPDYSAGYEALEEERKKSKAFLDMVFEEAERAGLCD